LDSIDIQDGIDAANNGDTVLVSDGTYSGASNKDLSWNGNEKHIVLKSENGSASCIIDCEGADRAFNFDSTNQHITDLIDGFTIRNGSIDYSGEPVNACGGGIYIANCDPIIKNCVLRNNLVYAYYSTPADQPLPIAVYAFGGGVYCLNSESRFQDCEFMRNNSSGGYFRPDSLYGTAVVFESGYGGGLSAENSSIRLYHCVFDSSLANQEGGAIYLINSNADIQACVINNNYSNFYGGAISCANSICNITNNLIVDNSSFWGTGALYGSNSCTLMVKNSTICGNKVTSSISKGGGIRCNNSYSLVTNTIFWNNIPNQILLENGASIDIAHSDIQGGEAGIVNNDNGTVDWQDGNIDSEPLVASDLPSFLMTYVLWKIKRVFLVVLFFFVYVFLSQ